MARDNSDNYFQRIIKLPKISSQLWSIIKDVLPETVTYNGDRYERAFISDQVTVSQHSGEHIGIHKDSDVELKINGKYVPNMRCFHKLTIYLNNLSNPDDYDDRRGGTSFYDDKNDIHILLNP